MPKRSGEEVVFPESRRPGDLEREVDDTMQKLGGGQFDVRRLGAHVARMEGRVLLQELLARAPRYEAIPERAERLRSEFFRGFGALPVRLGPRR